MQVLGSQLRVPHHLLRVLVPGHEHDFRDRVLPRLDKSADAFVSKVIQVQVMDSQLAAGAREDAGPTLAVEREDQLASFGLRADDGVAAPEQRHDLVIAQFPPRVLSVTDEDRAVLMVEVLPAQANDLTGGAEATVHGNPVFFSGGVGN